MSGATPAADWIGDAELRLPPGLVLSFQRYAMPASARVDSPPSSLGALPVGLARDGVLLVPLAPLECFWIGLNCEGARLAVAIAAELEGGVLIDALSGEAWNARQAARVPVPGTASIDGVRCADGLAPFLREGGEPHTLRVRRLVVSVDVDDGVTIELADYATFNERTGLAPPEPLDPEAGYKGWLLP